MVGWVLICWAGKSGLVSFGADDSNGKGGGRGWVGVEVSLSGGWAPYIPEPCLLQIFTLGQSCLQHRH